MPSPRPAHLSPSHSTIPHRPTPTASPLLLDCQTRRPRRAKSPNCSFLPGTTHPTNSDIPSRQEDISSLITPISAPTSGSATPRHRPINQKSGESIFGSTASLGVQARSLHSKFGGLSSFPCFGCSLDCGRRGTRLGSIRKWDSRIPNGVSGDLQ